MSCNNDDHEWLQIGTDGKNIKYICVKCTEQKIDAIKKEKESFFKALLKKMR